MPRTPWTARSPAASKTTSNVRRGSATGPDPFRRLVPPIRAAPCSGPRTRRERRAGHPRNTTLRHHRRRLGEQSRMDATTTRGRYRPGLSDSELLTLAVIQSLLGYTSEARPEPRDREMVRPRRVAHLRLLRPTLEMAVRTPPPHHHHTRRTPHRVRPRRSQRRRPRCRFGHGHHRPQIAPVGPNPHRGRGLPLPLFEQKPTIAGIARIRLPMTTNPPELHHQETGRSRRTRRRCSIR